MPEEAFTVKNLGEVIAKTLNLTPGSNVEILRDRSNPDRIMIVKHVEEV